MTKKITIMSLIAMLTLSLGYIGFYQWAKSRFLDNHKAIIKTLEKDGFTIQDNTPITFSGFPFKIIAHQDAFKAILNTKETYASLEAANTKVTLPFFNPLKWHIKSNLQLQGHFTPKALPLFFLSRDAKKKTLDFRMGAWSPKDQGKKLKFSLYHSGASLKFNKGSTIALGSLKLHNFKVLWNNPRETFETYTITGDTFKYKPHTLTASSNDGNYQFKFNNITIHRNNSQTKKENQLSFNQGTFKFTLKNACLLQKYLNAVERDIRKISPKCFKDATDKKLACLILPAIGNSLPILKEANSYLAAEGIIKENQEACTLAGHLRTDSSNAKIILAVKTDIAFPMFRDFILFVEQASPEVIALKKKSPLPAIKQWKIETKKELDLNIFTPALVNTVSRECCQGK
jgi:hypothetical protein